MGRLFIFICILRDAAVALVEQFFFQIAVGVQALEVAQHLADRRQDGERSARRPYGIKYDPWPKRAVVPPVWITHTPSPGGMAPCRTWSHNPASTLAL